MINENVVELDHRPACGGTGAASGCESRDLGRGACRFGSRSHVNDRDQALLSRGAHMPELPDPSLEWEEQSLADRLALTEMLVDKIIIDRHPSKIDKDGRRNYLIRAIPYQDPEQAAERLKAVHEARVKIVPRA
jgi:hypothetical protein